MPAAGPGGRTGGTAAGVGAGRPDGRDGGQPGRAGRVGGRLAEPAGLAIVGRPAGYRQVIRRFDAVWIEFLTQRADIQKQHSASAAVGGGRWV